MTVSFGSMPVDVVRRAESRGDVVEALGPASTDSHPSILEVPGHIASTGQIYRDSLDGVVGPFVLPETPMHSDDQSAATTFEGAGDRRIDPGESRTEACSNGIALRWTR